MRRFDPDPRLQIFQRLTLKRFSVWLPFGCQLTDTLLRNSLIRGPGCGRLCAETLAERGSCLVRRSTEDVRIELEKNIGTRVTRTVPALL
jgi:hypothetical protein